MGQKSKEVDDYFQCASPIWIVAITFGLWLLFMATFAPNHIPNWLGPFCWLGHYMGTHYPLACKLLSLGTVICHCLEAAYAEIVCVDKRLSLMASIKWTFQTLIFGFASLSLLLEYKGRPKQS